MKSLRILLILSSALQVFLFTQLVMTPSDIVTGFGIPASESADMIARRAGVLFLGMALVGLITAWRAQSTMLVSLSAIIAFFWAAMAGETFFEWNRGFANNGAIMPLIIEIAFALLIATFAAMSASHREQA